MRYFLIEILKNSTRLSALYSNLFCLKFFIASEVRQRQSFQTRDAAIGECVHLITINFTPSIPYTGTVENCSMNMFYLSSCSECKSLHCNWQNC